MSKIQSNGHSTNLAIWIPLAVAAAVYLVSAAGRAVIDYDEGYYSQAAQQMIARHDWITPYANGVRFFEKPPLLYWLAAVSFRIFGINEFALRLPTALGVIALVWVVMRIARRAAGVRAAMIAGLCTACSVGTYLFTRETLHDIWLALFLSLAMHAFLEWYWDPVHSLRHALVFYAALAGGVLCKSLVGIVFPVGIIAVFFLAAREWPKWRAMHILPGFSLFLLLAAPWHWLAATRNQDFLWSFFVNEQVLRFLGKNDPPLLWSLPLVTFWALVPVWFFPWTAFLPAALAAARKPADSRQRMLVKLAWVWVLVIMGFFSISSKLEHYAFPALPALSLLVGIALSRADGTRAVKWAFRGLAITSLVVLAAGAGTIFWYGAMGHESQDAASTRAGMVYQTDFSILANMPNAIMQGLLRPAVITIVAINAGFLAALVLVGRGRSMQAVMSVAAAMVVVCGMIHWSLIICEDMISSKKFALAIARDARPGDHLVVVGDYESANSLNFYQPLQVEIFDGVAYALVRGMRYPDAPRIMLTREEFGALWRSGNRVFVLALKDRLADLSLGGTEMLAVLDRVLIRNR